MLPDWTFFPRFFFPSFLPSFPPPLLSLSLSLSLFSFFLFFFSLLVVVSSHPRHPPPFCNSTLLVVVVDFLCRLTQRHTRSVSVRCPLLSLSLIHPLCPSFYLSLSLSPSLLSLNFDISNLATVLEMASVTAPSPKLDRYIVIHVATTCDEHGVYVTKDSAEVIELGWILLDTKTCEEVYILSILSILWWCG